jgi:RimJ/RimL family protein N-acetyltransferase
MSVTCLRRPSEPDLTSYLPTVVLRPLERGDSRPVLEVFAGLGSHSRALRFLSAKPRLTSADLRQLTDVDDCDHVAILAVSVLHGRAIGVARFVRDRTQPDTADVAVAVVDAWQDRGIGTLLAQALVRRARDVGVRRFTLAMAPYNEGAIRLLHRVPGTIERLALDDETAEFALTLDRPADARPA